MANAQELIDAIYKNRELMNMNPVIQRLLDKLQEESAEVIQAVSKIRRFGPHNHHPERTTTNLQELNGEIEDLAALIHLLELHGFVQLNQDSILRKAEALQ